MSSVNSNTIAPRYFYRAYRDPKNFYYNGGGASSIDVLASLQNPDCCYPGIPSPVILLCCNFFIVLFYLIFLLSNTFSKLFFKSYSHLSKVDKTEWNSRIVSTCHAVIASILSFYIYWTNEEYAINIVFAQPDSTVVLSCFSTGYIIFDTILLILNRGEQSIFGWPIFIHHIVSILTVLLNFTFGFASAGGIFLLITESSTPFVNLRWMLVKCSLRDSIWYSCNGIALAATFFMCRVVWPISGALYYNMYYRHLIVKVPVILEIIAWMFLAFYVVLNARWFSQIYHGLVRVLRGKSDEKKS